MNARVALFCVTCLLPQAAFADLLDRLETATEAALVQSSTFMTGRLPALQGHVPPTEWAAEDRTIGQCMLDALAAEQGADAAEAYVAAMETWSGVQITSMMQMATAMPPELAEPYLMDMGLACGQLDRASALMAESGMMEIIQDPANLEILMAE